MAFVNVNLGSGFVECFLQQNDVLLVLFALYHDFLDGAFLLSQDLDGLGMSSLLFFQFKFQITNACFQLADDALAASDGVQFDFLKADRQVLQADILKYRKGP